MGTPDDVILHDPYQTPGASLFVLQTGFQYVSEGDSIPLLDITNYGCSIGASDLEYEFPELDQRWCGIENYGSTVIGAIPEPSRGSGYTGSLGGIFGGLLGGRADPDSSLQYTPLLRFSPEGDLRQIPDRCFQSRVLTAPRLFQMDSWWESRFRSSLAGNPRRGFSPKSLKTVWLFWFAFALALAISTTAVASEVVGVADEALQRFQEIAATGIDFVRIVPGSRDMPAEVAGPSIQAIAQVAQRLSS